MSGDCRARERWPARFAGDRALRAFAGGLYNGGELPQRGESRRTSEERPALLVDAARARAIARSRCLPPTSSPSASARASDPPLRRAPPIGRRPAAARTRIGTQYPCGPQKCARPFHWATNAPRPQLCRAGDLRARRQPPPVIWALREICGGISDGGALPLRGERKPLATRRAERERSPQPPFAEASVCGADRRMAGARGETSPLCLLTALAPVSASSRRRNRLRRREASRGTSSQS